MAALKNLPILPKDAVLFAKPFILAKMRGILCGNLCCHKNRPNPNAKRRKPDPQIRCNLKPGQATGERDANRIPI
jgi:hypothetical protein